MEDAVCKPLFYALVYYKALSLGQLQGLIQYFCPPHFPCHEISPLSSINIQFFTSSVTSHSFHHNHIPHGCRSSLQADLAPAADLEHLCATASTFPWSAPPPRTSFTFNFNFPLALWMCISLMHFHPCWPLSSLDALPAYNAAWDTGWLQLHTRLSVLEWKDR